MDALWGLALWRQFGAAIDVLEQAIAACPDISWTERIWPEPPPDYFPPQFGEFWYVSFHTLVWLDIYLAGVGEEDFEPPAPFLPGELDSREATPDRPYGKDLLRKYLSQLRTRCRATLTTLTEEQARRLVDYPWTRGQPVTYLELVLYNLRHVQEHAAQLSLFLGQRGVPSAALRALARASDE